MRVVFDEKMAKLGARKASQGGKNTTWVQNAISQQNIATNMSKGSVLKGTKLPSVTRNRYNRSPATN